ncbi:uncharacterized protein LOC131839844 [Mustela lutreola]|uniref:uncharacterized protein LOC131839844 n=1 Tax=Mustela lutreola TaxID=9666 RepID=UPI002797404E|nr:uncharacterized protein LOC131839844 [Mustela lutreola]
MTETKTGELTEEGDREEDRKPGRRPPPSQPHLLTSGVEGRRLALGLAEGAGCTGERCGSLSDWHSPGQLRVREALPQALEPEDSVGDDGSSGLWLRTSRLLPRLRLRRAGAPQAPPAPTRAAHAHPFLELPCPPSSPLPAASERAHARRPCGLLPPLGPLGTSAGTPGPPARAPCPGGGGPPAPFPPPSNQIGRGERSPGNALAGGLRVQALAPRLSEAFVQLRVTIFCQFKKPGCAFLPVDTASSPNPQSTMRKTPEKPQWKDIPHNTGAALWDAGHQKQRKVEKMSQSGST